MLLTKHTKENIRLKKIKLNITKQNKNNFNFIQKPLKYNFEMEVTQ